MTTEYICPRHDHVLVRPLKRTQITIGSLFIPDNAHDVQDRMVVLAIGPNCIDLDIGDVILVPQYHANPVTYRDEKDLYFIREHDVLAKVIP